MEVMWLFRVLPIHLPFHFPKCLCGQQSISVPGCWWFRDAYFFIYDPAFSATPSDFCMLALAKKNRLRLINCNHLLEPLEKAITLAGFGINEKLDYHGCNEIRLLGSPWWATGPQAIAASRSLSRIMEVFGQHSYTPLYAIDVSRRPTEKGSILFIKNPFPMNSKYACLSLNGANTLRLLDFPPDICVSMREALYQFYPMGVRNEVQLPDSNLEINVLASPWAHFPNNYNKKAGCQLHMRGVLGKMMVIAAQFGWYVSIFPKPKRIWLYCRGSDRSLSFIIS